MAQQATMNQQSSPQQYDNRSSAAGWATFAGVIMILVGVFQAFQGLAALINDDIFFVGVNYVYSIDVTTWGWVHLVLGIFVAIAGYSIFSGALWARVTGIVLAMLSATVNFFFIPYYPFWSILIIAMDIAIIWGLANFNGRRQQYTP
jgi:uncharacterized membrane protein